MTGARKKHKSKLCEKFRAFQVQLAETVRLWLMAPERTLVLKHQVMDVPMNTSVSLCLTFSWILGHFSYFLGKKSRDFVWDCMLLWKLQRFQVALSYCKHLGLVFPLPYVTLLHTIQHLRRAKHSHIIFIINWCPWQIQQVKYTVLLCRPNISHTLSTLLSLFLTYRGKGEFCSAWETLAPEWCYLSWWSKQMEELWIPLLTVPFWPMLLICTSQALLESLPWGGFCGRFILAACSFKTWSPHFCITQHHSVAHAGHELVISFDYDGKLQVSLNLLISKCI